MGQAKASFTVHSLFTVGRPSIASFERAQLLAIKSCMTERHSQSADGAALKSEGGETE